MLISGLRADRPPGMGPDGSTPCGSLARWTSGAARREPLATGLSVPGVANRRFLSQMGTSRQRRLSGRFDNVDCRTENLPSGQ